MIINPSDWDNDDTDDPDFWEEQFIENDYDDGERCPWCGTNVCAFVKDGKLKRDPATEATYER